MSNLCSWKRAALLALPLRAWDDTENEYDSLLIFNARTKHDSGWSHINVVGCRKQVPVELCVTCADDLEWILPAPTKCADFLIGQMRMDCLYPAGILHAWTRKGRFTVGAAISSVTIELHPDSQP